MSPLAPIDHPRVIVGVDDDPASGQALRFAAVEAAYRGGDVLAMHVWQSTTAWGNPDFREIDELPGDYALNKLTQVVNAVLRERAESGLELVKITAQAVEGNAAHELISAARGAALLVLGKRHHNRMLGSVSQSCINNPPCAILIVPAPAPS